ncbi:MAG: folate-binding protein [Gammaproteobacteria bacterium]|nr:folate-binding protein [Gammaproteobacteria bacterium]
MSLNLASLIAERYNDTTLPKLKILMMETLNTTPCYIPLTQLGVLNIAGDDAQTFLQSMFTNDVAALAINQGQLSGFCNAKGRLFGLFLLIRRKGYYQLVLPKNMCNSLQQRLTMFVLRSKVTISDETANLVSLGLSYPDNNQADFLSMPDEIYQAIEEDGQLLIRLPSDMLRVLWIGSSEQASQLEQTLVEHQWQQVSNTVWDLLDIEAGIPAVLPETKEKFTPQQVNLDLVNGVSFKKGCYPGQEVVARLHYLGKPSRRMFIAKAQTTEQIEVGTEITTDSGDIAGHVVSAQHTDPDTILLLVSLKLSSQTASLLLAPSTTVMLISPPIEE